MKLQCLKALSNSIKRVCSGIVLYLVAVLRWMYFSQLINTNLLLPSEYLLEGVMNCMDTEAALIIEPLH